MRTRLVILSILTGLLSSCGNGVREKYGFEQWDAVVEQNRLLELVNQFRSQPRLCGEEALEAAPPLRISRTLNRVSWAHSSEMAEKRYFDHQSPDGGRFTDRAKEAGYDGCPRGENIAWHTSEEPDAERAFRQWRESPGHCRVMMGASADELGFGFAEGLSPSTTRTGFYYTMVTGDSDCP